MQIWHYDRVTGELLGAGIADPNPVESGEWLLPAHSTATAPPAPQTGTAHVFAGAAWSSVADHRGETWWLADAKDNTAPQIVTALGDPTAFMSPLTKTEPPAPPAPPPVPAVATPHQLFTALATAMGIAPDKIEALAELAKTL